MLNILGLKKKLEGATKWSACRDIGLWIKCIMNHMYYVATTTSKGDLDVMERKWNVSTPCSEHSWQMYSQGTWRRGQESFVVDSR